MKPLAVPRVEYVALVDEIATDAVLDLLAVARMRDDFADPQRTAPVWRRQDGLWCPVPDGGRALTDVSSDVLRSFDDEEMAPLLTHVLKQVDKSTRTYWVIPRLSELPPELTVFDEDTRSAFMHQTVRSREDGWLEFQNRLAEVLHVLGDAHDSGHLILSVPTGLGGGNRDPYIQIATFGNGQNLRVEAAGSENVEAELHMVEISRRRLLHHGWWLDSESGNLAAEAGIGFAASIAEGIVTVARQGFVVEDVASIQVTMWGAFASTARRCALSRLFEPPPGPHLAIVGP